MIGSETTKKTIAKKIKEIAHYNKQEYGHIINLTDDNDTYIILGWGKQEYEDKKHRLLFDVIFGDVTYSDGTSISITEFDFFELSEDFIKDHDAKIEYLKNALDEVTKEEKKAIDILDSILKRW